MVELWTPEREVQGKSPTIAVYCLEQDTLSTGKYEQDTLSTGKYPGSGDSVLK